LQLSFGGRGDVLNVWWWGDAFKGLEDACLDG